MQRCSVSRVNVIFFFNRKPFSGKASGPLRGDHSIMTSDKRSPSVRTASPLTQTSSGSAPVRDDVDHAQAQAARAQNEFAELKQIYDRMKELDESPSRDRELDSVLQVRACRAIK